MRIRVLFASLSIVAAVAIPLITSASKPPISGPAGVTASAGSAGPNVTASNPAKTCILKLFKAQQTASKTGKATGGLTSELKDNCTDETVTEDAQGKRTYTQTGREGGKNDVTKSGQCIVDSCSKPTCGTITLVVNIPGVAASAPVSKCDAAGKQMVDSANTPDGAKNLALNAINQQAIQNVVNGNSAGDKQSLLESFGVPSGDAQKLAQNNPQDANQLLTALASGDSNQITDAKTQVQTDTGITLNSDLQDITTLSPQQLSQNLSNNNLLSADAQNNINNINSSSTFGASDPTTTLSSASRGGQYADTFSQLEQKYGLPQGYLAGVATVESKGNPSICTTIPGSSACGMFQYTKTTWLTDSALINNGVPLPDSDRLDPAISAEVTAAAAARNLQNYGDTINNSGMDTSAALYSMHNLGANGGSQFMNAFAADPNQPVNQVLSAVQIRNNPSLYGNGSISLAQAQNNMIAAMNGNATFTSSSAAASISSPLALGGVYQDTSYITNGQSPFAGVSLIPPNAYPQTAPQGVGQLTPVSYPQGTSSSGTSSTGNTPTSNSPNTASIGQTGSAVTQIIAQPSTVTHGSSVSISWSSAGLSSANACSVFEGASTVIAQGNEGTLQVSVTSSGTTTFSVKCTVTATGQQISSSASVKVQ